MGVLDILNGYNEIGEFLDKQKDLGDDLLALKRIAKDWKTTHSIDVGESGTLYRIFKFINWKFNFGKKFKISGTLKNRKVTNDSNVVNLSQKKLLKLDNGTSQWATAMVLCGDKERLKNPPYKLARTYEAVSYWNKQRKNLTSWEPRYDETILNQVKVYSELLKGKRPKFKPEQAEDFCFAYTFGYITLKQAEKKWPSLRGHESDRISEMKKVIEHAESDDIITSKDHRVVQAIAMWGKVSDRKVIIKFPSSVNKSWPQFWKFIKKAAF